jgi:hypothetical protein
MTTRESQTRIGLFKTAAAGPHIAFRTGPSRTSEHVGFATMEGVDCYSNRHI